MLVRLIMESHSNVFSFNLGHWQPMAGKRSLCFGEITKTKSNI